MRQNNIQKDCTVEALSNLGVPVLEVIRYPHRDEEIYVIPDKDLGMLVDIWCDNRNDPRLRCINTALVIAPTRGGYEDMTPPDCYVQGSRTLIGIIHDCYCDDVDWWNAEQSIEMVDDYVITHRIPDIKENYLMVMDAITREGF